MNNATAKRRDLLFFILLIVMIQVALSKKELPKNHPALFAPANKAENASTFHELDQELMDRLASLRSRVKSALSAHNITQKQKEKLTATYERLAYLLRK